MPRAYLRPGLLDQIRTTLPNGIRRRLCVRCRDNRLPSRAISVLNEKWQQATHEHRRVNHTQPRHPLHAQVRVHDTVGRAMRGHPRGTHEVERRARVRTYERLGVPGQILRRRAEVPAPHGCADEALRERDSIFEREDVEFARYTTV